MSAFVSPVTVPAHEEVDDAALLAEMERLSSYIQALELTHCHLQAQLDQAQRGAEAVQKQLAPGKREHAREPERAAKGRARQEEDHDDSLLHGLGAMGVGSSGAAAVAAAVAAADAEVCVESFPTYRSAGFSTPTTGDCAADLAADEFDGAALEYDQPQVTYRSCALHGSDPIDEEDMADTAAASAACAEEAPAPGRAALCAAVAGLGALAKPARAVAPRARGAAAGAEVSDAAVSDAAVEQQLEKLAAAVRAFLAV